MQVLLISGEDNSGKSTLIHSIATWLKRRDYKPKDVNPNGFWKFYEVANGDVQTLFEKMMFVFMFIQQQIMNIE